MVIFVQLIYSYTSVKGAPVNYSGKSSCDERIYQPYMERQETILLILHVINIQYVPALYGASVNYSGNCLCDECTYQPYMECQ